MMFDQDGQAEALNRQRNLKSALGTVLILSGLGAALGILVEIYALFVSPQELAIFRELFSDRVTISWQGGNLAVPSDLVAYGLPILLLFVAAGIASTCLNAGLSLLHDRR